MLARVHRPPFFVQVVALHVEHEPLSRECFSGVFLRVAEKLLPQPTALVPPLQQPSRQIKLERQDLADLRRAEVGNNVNVC